MNRILRRQRKPQAFDPDPDAPPRNCDNPSCMQMAGYRAPIARDLPGQYYWFCLDHVKEYNSRWNYYRGMTPSQFEAELQSDVFWNRPSWRLGQLGVSQKLDEAIIADTRLLFDLTHGSKMKRHNNPLSIVPPKLKISIRVLGLDWPFTLSDLKSRYKSLAKEHHPDKNNGDRNAEELLKRINVAYSMIKAHLTSYLLSSAEPPTE